MILLKLILITPLWDPRWRGRGGVAVGQESIRQEARRLAVERLTALGERDSAVRDTEPRAGVALLPIRCLDS